MKIQITMTLDDEYADSDHEMGITNEGYERMVDELNQFGKDIEIEAVR